MAMLHLPATGIVPVTASIDISLATQLTFKGPFWVSLSAWVHNPDPDAGFLGFDLVHTDATGVEKSFDFGQSTVLTLADGNSAFNTAVRALTRQSESSSWHLDLSLLGSAEDSLISYEFMIAPLAEGEVSELAF